MPLVLFLYLGSMAPIYFRYYLLFFHSFKSPLYSFVWKLSIIFIYDAYYFTFFISSTLDKYRNGCIPDITCNLYPVLPIFYTHHKLLCVTQLRTITTLSMKIAA